ncbi:MAG: radical SAM protein [Desulfobacterales bacterium]
MKKKARYLRALVANRKGEIYELEDYAAGGMAAGQLVPLERGNTIELPFGGELMFLPGRVPILFDLHNERFEQVAQDPRRRGTPIFPVAAFNSPGYVVRWISAFTEGDGAAPLPLFSYGAVGWHRNGYRSAVFRVDRERRQDLRLMPPEAVATGIRTKRRQMPANRLREHLETCALVYGCPAAKNFFLGRSEAPLPTAQRCNARCRGCLSLQEGSGIPHSQNRICFTPSPPEITAVALSHLRRVRRGVVSFGQGCEGDPLLAADVIEPAIRSIRAATVRGTVNLNTNGSRPAVLAALMDAGLDSIRISLNSVRSKCYAAYFRPVGYRFSDVVAGIDLALQRGIHVALNYLNLPGFTDTPEEVEALTEFLRRHPVQMIQWRNLNYDPLRYWEMMTTVQRPGNPLGMTAVFDEIRRRFPALRHGYFNPPKEKFSGPVRSPH